MRAKISQRLLKILEPQDKPYEVVDEDLSGFLLRVQPSGAMTFFVSYRLNGRRNRVRIGSTRQATPQQARDKAKGVLADVVKGEDPAKARKATKQHTLRSYLDERYGPWMTQHRKSGTYQVERIRVAFPGLLDKGLDDLTGWAIEKWKTKKRKDGMKAATVNRNVAALKAALSRACEWELVDANPLAKVKMLREEGGEKTRFLSPEEEKRLYGALEAREERMRKDRDSANEWRRDRGYDLLPDFRAVPFADYVRPMVTLLLNLGLRRNELFSLTWGDVDFDAGEVTVRSSVAKSLKARHVPMNDTALQILNDWRFQTDGDALVFPSRGGKSFNTIKRVWANLLNEAKIKNFRLHDCRHTFASRLVQRGVSLYTVKALLGHSSIKTTERYSHLQPRAMADAVRQLDAPESNVVEFPSADARG